MTFYQCCMAIIAAGNSKKQVNQVDYAVGYARTGLHMRDEDAIRTQALYLLNNITSWRGDVAKEVRAALKGFAK